jgi:hypothetical protein
VSGWTSGPADGFPYLPDYHPEIVALNDRWFRLAAAKRITTTYPNPYPIL